MLAYWKRTLDCDTDTLNTSCRSIETFVREEFPEPCPDPLSKNFYLYDLYNHYNIFAYPAPQISQLFLGIKTAFKEINSSEGMWIKGWVNIYKGKDSHNWHNHKSYTQEDTNHLHQSYHGIFCVNGSGSFTTYRNRITKEQHHIQWEPNELAIIPTHDDWLHRSWPYVGDGERITVAFNIMHQDHIDTFRYKNCWTPL